METAKNIFTDIVLIIDLILFSYTFIMFVFTINYLLSYMYKGNIDYKRNAINCGFAVIHFLLLGIILNLLLPDAFKNVILPYYQGH